LHLGHPRSLEFWKAIASPNQITCAHTHTKEKRLVAERVGGPECGTARVFTEFPSPRASKDEGNKTAGKERGRRAGGGGGIEISRCLQVVAAGAAAAVAATS